MCSFLFAAGDSGVHRTRVDLRGPRREFNVPLEELKIKERSVDFIYAPFVIDNMLSPLRAIRLWRDALKPNGTLAIVINDRDKLLRQGRDFNATRWYGNDLWRLLRDAGFADDKIAEIDLGQFSLCGNDPGHTGYFAVR